MNKLSFILYLVVSLIILQLNVRLYTASYSQNETRADIVKQLNFLEIELKEKEADVKMQSIFPEGYVFINALYGLAWCELAINEQDELLKKRAIKEALFAFNNIDSDKAKYIFPQGLEPEFGIFYNGWRNYLLSKIFQVSPNFEGANGYRKKLLSQSDQIAHAISNSSVPYLESYRNSTWPADTYIGMASLANTNKINKRYSNLLNDWLSKVQSNLDSNTQLLPHLVDSETGSPIIGARGCSMTLMLRMLAEINPEFGAKQFKKYHELFYQKTFGLPSVREYPKGTLGLGDIDSGPVIFGVGFSATIVSIGTFAAYDTAQIAEKQFKTIHGFGFSLSSDTNKQYIFGALPMADAFIAWGRASALNYDTNSDNSSLFWAFQFHIISSFVLAIIWGLYYRKKIWSFIRKKWD